MPADRSKNKSLIKIDLANSYVVTAEHRPATPNANMHSPDEVQFWLEIPANHHEGTPATAIQLKGEPLLLLLQMLSAKRN
jgi:hypothetical protein